MRALTRVMAREALHYFETLRAVLECSRDPQDRMLPHYAGNWWSTFKPRSGEKYRHSPCDLLAFWETQRKTLPLIKNQTTIPLQFNTGAMTGNELRLAWTIVSDTLTMLDDGLGRSLTAIADATASIVKHEAMLRDLRLLEERLLQEEEAQTRRSGLCD